MIKKFFAILLGAFTCLVNAADMVGEERVEAEFEAALAAVDLDMVAPLPDPEDAEGAEGIVQEQGAEPAPAAHPPIIGHFVPPVLPPAHQVALRNARADAHDAAFPFAAIGRPFLCNIQKAWLRRWMDALAHRGDIPAGHRSYPLRYLIPSFGWEEVWRLPHRNESCQMCGKDSIHLVIIMRNLGAIPGCRILRVGMDCAIFMQMGRQIVWQTAWDNDSSLP